MEGKIYSLSSVDVKIALAQKHPNSSWKNRFQKSRKTIGFQNLCSWIENLISIIYITNGFAFGVIYRFIYREIGGPIMPLGESLRWAKILETNKNNRGSQLLFLLIFYSNYRDVPRVNSSSLDLGIDSSLPSFIQQYSPEWHAPISVATPIFPGNRELENQTHTNLESGYTSLVRKDI